jgi:hypothetical protein
MTIFAVPIYVNQTDTKPARPEQSRRRMTRSLSYKVMGYDRTGAL